VVDQIFQTIQIEKGRWRYLPVSCAISGEGVADITDDEVTVSYIKYGQLAFGTKSLDEETALLAADVLEDATEINIGVAQSFPPTNGRLQINPVADDPTDIYDYSEYNSTTGVVTLVGALGKGYLIDAPVLRVDWIEPFGGIDGTYLMLFTPDELDTLDLFTYTVVKSGEGPLFDPFQSTVDIIDAEPPGTKALSTSISTCTIEGWVVDISGNAVSNTSVYARLLGTPATGNGFISEDNVVSAKTDINGYFSITVIQGITVDFVIPSTGYRRTVVVPSSTSINLFEIA
jgi:hypothetical protein